MGHKLLVLGSMDLQPTVSPGCSEEPRSQARTWTPLSLHGGRGLSQPDILILPNVHAVKLGNVADLYLYILDHFPAGVDPVAFEGAEDGIEAASFYLVPAFQGFYHLPVVMRVFQVHVEGGRLGGAGSVGPSFAAP
jgi:hypothetical protein